MEIKPSAEWFITGIVSLLILYLAVRAWATTAGAHAALKREEEAVAALSGGIPPGDVPLTGDVRDAAAFRYLTQARESGVFDPDPLLYARRIAEARYLAGIFVFIGLGGTVLGIAVSLVGLGNVTTGASGTTANDLQNVMSAVSAVLGGMRSAAICTLVGIVATLAVSGRNAAYLKAADAVLAATENIWLKSVEPARRAAETAAQWQRNSLLLREVLQDVMAGVIERENEATRQSNREFAETISAAQESQGKQLMQGMEFIAGALFEPAQALRDAVGEFRKEMVGTATWLSNAAQTADRVSATLETASRQQRDALKGMEESTAAMRTQVDAMNAAMVRTLAETGAATAQTTSELRESVAANVGVLREGVAANMGDLRETVAASLGVLRAGVGDHLQNIGTAQEKLNDNVAALSGSVALFAEGNAASLQALESERDERDREREGWEIELNAMLREQERVRQAWASERGETIAAFGRERETAFASVTTALASVEKMLEAHRRDFQAATAALQVESLREIRTVRETTEAAITNAQAAVAAMQTGAKTSAKLVTDAAQSALANARVVRRSGLALPERGLQAALRGVSNRHGEAVVCGRRLATLLD